MIEISKDEEIKIVQLYVKQKYTLRRIAKIYHTDHHRIGRILEKYKIKISNDELREDIIRVLTTFNWKEYLNCIAMRKIQQFHIIDVLKENVKDIE